MRDKQHQRESVGAPAGLTNDGMNAWYLQQRQREKELRQRRREAAELLRGYRGGSIDAYRRTSRGTAFSPGSTVACGTDNIQDIPQNDSYDMEQLERAEKERLERQQREFLLLQKESEGEEKKQEEETNGEELRVMPSEDTTDNNISKEDSFEETIWRDFISSEPGAKFPPEAGRYHLYCSFACPGSHRALIVRTLKGLEDVISVTYVHPTWRLTNPEDPEDKHRGWVFGDPHGEPFSNTIQRGGPFPPAYDQNEPDPNFDAFSIREIYEIAHDNSGKYTIPLLWDTKLNTIVNNESSDIAYMLNSCLNDFAQNPDLDLYTEDSEEGLAKLNEVSEWLSPLMIHGVYRCGFAKNQRAYDKAIDDLCMAFDRADDMLQQQRYLTGDTLTDADIRLFVTLLRFDEVYAFYFKANARLVMLTPSLLNFCREIYQLPGVVDTCNMEQIKAHFFGSHAEWNKYSVIPRGLGFVELLDMPHHRDTFFGENNHHVERTEL